jgi:hypothetical protein
MAGVGKIPQSHTFVSPDKPDSSASSKIGPESLVSRPMQTVKFFFVHVFKKNFSSEVASFVKNFPFTGKSPNLPLMPSVPKYFIAKRKKYRFSKNIFPACNA